MRRIGWLVAVGMLAAVLAGCAGSPPPSTVVDGDIDAHIAEASRRFDMPEHWIREVIRQESGGRTHVNGRPIVSGAGAMGLMQVMPGTYSELRRKHGLGPDPFSPRDNILAGTAYMREMYDMFGAPGFLAAYNCGPGCYSEYLAGNRSLPRETQRYLASVGPRLNRIPTPSGQDIVTADLPRSEISRRPAPPQVVAVVAPEPEPPLPTPPLPTPPAVPAARQPQPVQVAALAPPPAAPAGGQWTVQIGAFKSPDDSGRAIDRARSMAPDHLNRSQRIVQPINSPFGQLYRARLAGLSQQAAANACANLVSQGMACFVVAPGA